MVSITVLNVNKVRAGMQIANFIRNLGNSSLNLLLQWKLAIYFLGSPNKKELRLTAQSYQNTPANAAAPLEPMLHPGGVGSSGELLWIGNICIPPLPESDLC